MAGLRLGNGNTDFVSMAEEILRRCGNLRFRASGKSMSPFIRDGDIVNIAPCPERVNTGDIVFFKNCYGRLLLHRVIWRNNAGVITRGDALPLDDGFIPASNILGRAVSVEGRIFNLHLRRPFKYFVSRAVVIKRRLAGAPFIRMLLRNCARLLY